MKFVSFTLNISLFLGITFHSSAFEFNWKIDETLDGTESATIGGEETDSESDVNGDGMVNILDLVQIENHI